MVQVLEIFMLEGKDLPHLYTQYRGCWRLDSTGCLVISSHGIDLISPEYSGLSPSRGILNQVLPLQTSKHSIIHCPASRTTLVATRFRVAVICPIIQVPHCIRVFFYFVWFVFINHIFQFYYELCTYCNILDIYLS